MLTLYAKNVANNIPAKVLKKIKEEISAEGQENIGQEILEGIRQLKRGEHGRVIKGAINRSNSREDWPFAAEMCGVAGCIRPHASGMGTRSSRAVRRGANAPSDRRQEPTCAAGRRLRPPAANRCG